MLRTLYSRLALTLFVLLCLVGVLLVEVIGHASTLYQQEVAQKLNRDLAMYVVGKHSLLHEDGINKPALDSLFHQMMVINPSIEVYLLDNEGNIIGYNAPEGAVKRSRVSLQPIQAYIDGAARFPLKGDDPRSVDRKKVFSASRIESDAGMRGYLYIVLGGENYEHVVQMLGHSFIVDSALVVLLAALFVALTGGLLVFALLTRRLRLLGNIMRRFSGNDENARLLRYPAGSHDEIDELGQQFNSLADRINSQVQQLRRMDNARREMVANISHDLRTPLTTMRGYLETLDIRQGKLSDEERQRYLKTALLYSQRLGRMVEELFELARLDSVESVVYSEPFSMCELVQDVSQPFLLRAQEKQVALDVSLNPDTPQVHADISMMQRVLENLLENGLRHTPPGGRILVAVDVESGNVLVRVADTGCGIPAEDVPHIFERFYRQDRNRSDSENAGLGLAIVRRILELHGSIIQVSSEPERGTTFSFSMPASPA